ncbi:hypothetical protein H5410_030234 [Solanum commersonii]|uniref:Uncharacterized protein n=1 Tax=Solanum commersonii TaxID=4109 RepID=A0A9J5YGV1_SOLCO|nr:hypothetical protein H5410_030234 [Solanum commersonii]
MIQTPFPFDSTHFHHDRRRRPNTNWELEHAHANCETLRYDDPYLIWFQMHYSFSFYSIK